MIIEVNKHAPVAILVLLVFIQLLSIPQLGDEIIMILKTEY
jgi:hypothetical protein